jgi:hypothetical protein
MDANEYAGPTPDTGLSKKKKKQDTEAIENIGGITGALEGAKNKAFGYGDQNQD